MRGNMHLYQYEKLKKYHKELAYVLYFWGFTIIRPLLENYSNYSTLILFSYSIILLSISLKGISRDSLPFKNYLLIYCMLLILFLDLLFRKNSLTILYIYEFLINGVIPIVMISRIKFPEVLLKFYVAISVIAFLLYFSDPFNSYQVFGDYMTFGFMLALPAYIGIYIGRRIFKFKWLFPIEIICLIEALIFANRSVILSIMVFLSLIEFYYIKRSYKKNLKLFFTSIGIVIVSLNIENLVYWIASIIGKYGLNSYSLKHAQASVSDIKSDNLFSGRIEIWDLAKEMMKENFLFGNGTASFQATYGMYTHNFYYDLIIQYGLIGALVMVILIILLVIIIFKQKEYNRLLGIMLLCMWFPKLLFSTYFTKDIGLWSFISLGLLYSHNNFIAKSQKKLT